FHRLKIFSSALHNLLQSVEQSETNQIIGLPHKPHRLKTKIFSVFDQCGEVHIRCHILLSHTFERMRIQSMAIETAQRSFKVIRRIKVIDKIAVIDRYDKSASERQSNLLDPAYCIKPDLGNLPFN